MTERTLSIIIPAKNEEGAIGKVVGDIVSRYPDAEIIVVDDGSSDGTAEGTQSHQPIVITAKRSTAVLVSQEDWSAMQETLYLLSVPGMRESIREGIDTPINECDESLDW